MIAWSLADLFIAGAETTSTTVRWFMLYMITHPEIQKKIHNEIDSVIGKDRMPAWDDKLNHLLQELAWDAVTKHAMSGVRGEGNAK